MPSTVRTVSASSTIDPGSPERSDSTCTSAGAGPSAGTISSTTPERARCDGLSTVGPTCGQRAGEGLDGAVGQARRRWRAPRRSGAGRRRRRRRPSRRRWSRAPSCAPSRARPAPAGGRGSRAGAWNRAASGSARRSSSRSASAPRRLTSTRFEVTPMSMLARAPERSSPSTRVSPSAGGVGQVAGERGHLEVELVLQVVGLGHDPARARAGASGGPTRSCTAGRP